MNTLFVLGIIAGVYGIMYGIMLRILHNAEEYPEEISSQEIRVEAY